MNGGRVVTDRDVACLLCPRVTLANLLVSPGEVLLMELGKMNRLLTKLNSTIKNVQLAVKGFVVFSPELEEVGTCFLANKVRAARTCAWSQVFRKSCYPVLLVCRVGTK